MYTKEEKRLANRDWYLQNREKKNEKSQEYYRKNKEKIKEKKRKRECLYALIAKKTLKKID